MKRFIEGKNRWSWPVKALLLLSLLFVTGCATTGWTPTQKGAATGAAAGAGLGAIIGHQSGETAGGALLGAVTGGLAGALIGNAIGRNQQTPPSNAQHSPDVQPFAAEALLTTEDVVSLSEAGVNDEVVIAKIRSSHSVFDLSADEIITLREAGVSDRVITAMLRTYR